MYLQLVLITSVICLMVQSAPVNVGNDHLQKRSSYISENQRVFEKDLYCAAMSLRNTARKLRLNLTLPSYPQVDINVKTETIMNATFDYFSKECKNFTTAMMIKHQLQDFLFNTDVITPELSVTTELNSDNIKRVATILTNLQTMANTFDNMQFSKHRSSCVRLTPIQYTIMYHVRYSNISLLQSLKDMESWALDESYYEYPEARHC